MANVLVVGSGGREHAIAWKLAQSEQVKKVYAAPGSCGIQSVEKAENVKINVGKFDEVGKFCKDNQVNLVVVGPEDPLANGIADALESEGISVFGPKRNGAQIESDKSWAKTFMDKYGIPTARWKSFTSAEEANTFINNANFPALVVKASGLAAGKGVVVAPNKQNACAAVNEILQTKKFGAAGETVVVEELLTGEEVSVLAFCDGNTVRAMLPAQDHKRIYDGDKGPNTGGMGAYCPCPLLSEKDLRDVETGILQRTLDGLKQEGIKYIGVLYAGLMLTKEGPKVLEFNCRFGDPETEVILPLLETDLYQVMVACCKGNLGAYELKFKAGTSAVGVVMASKGYPESSSKGQVITGLYEVEKLPSSLVFHCGVAAKDSKLVTNGGRVLIAVALAPQLVVAAAKATNMCSIIKFDGEQHRNDIAHKGIARSILQSGKLTYKDSGVDISAGNALVSNIKKATVSTQRVGVIGGIGGFGGLFDVKLAGFKDPILVSGTDGVGTKLKIAQEMQMHGTIGIDLVAMCVNDILAHGAEPLFFLDYIACGKLDIKVAEEVVVGTAEGCKQAGCALIGGETAEMPDMYQVGEYDAAGFAVGAVERNNVLPNTEKIRAGDVVIGLPSSGVHSNGFSLVRKVVDLAGVKYTDEAVFSKDGRTYGEEFLTPTKIYVKPVLKAIKTGKIKAFAHITGGGLVENVPRVLTTKLGVKLDAEKWSIPPVYGWLAAFGKINENELLRTFNCGIGAVLIVAKEDESEILRVVAEEGERFAANIGQVFDRSGEIKQVVVDNFVDSMDKIMRPYLPNMVQHSAVEKKRVGVLISGSGTNLQALIDATLDPSQHVGAEIALVISNKPDVEGLKRAQRANIPTKIISHKDYPNRSDFDRAMLHQLHTFNVEIVCLAGFMRILTGEFVSAWHGRLLNIHPSLLPLFKGVHAQRQALEAGVRVSGCTVHFVEEDIDSGAIVTQEAVSVEAGDREEDLVERIKGAEHRAFPRALKWVATGRVKLGDDNKIVWS